MSLTRKYKVAQSFRNWSLINFLVFYLYVKVNKNKMWQFIFLNYMNQIWEWMVKILCIHNYLSFNLQHQFQGD
jgi:hypothetical protein